MGKKILIYFILFIILVPTTICIRSSETENEDLIQNPTKIDYNYIWNETNVLANVTYDYLPGEIPRGRSLGSSGGTITENHILGELTNFSLDDIHYEQLGYINDNTPNHPYSAIINVTDFGLEINDCPSYPYPYSNPIDKREMFAMLTENQTTCSILTSMLHSKFPIIPPIGGNTDFNISISHTNTLIVPNDITKIWWDEELKLGLDFIRQTKYDYLSNIHDPLLGNLSYLDENDPIPEPENQTGQVFIMDDTPESQEKIENLTNPEGGFGTELTGPHPRYEEIVQKRR